MKVCIIGNGLVSLTLAKALVNESISVDIISNKKKVAYNKGRTLGISKSNVEFFNKNILNIEKLLWDINKIEIYSEKLKNNKILNFQNNNQRLFSIIENYKLYNLLFSKLKKNKYLNFKANLDEKKYKLIINCDHKSKITKKIFFKKFYKNYKSRAFTTIIKHEKINDNNIASQIFTQNGPLAFLPIKKDHTSIVYSVRGKKEINLKNVIEKYNAKYKIINIDKIYSFDINFSNLRNYYHKNILAFGDLLHQLHPLAGQGFNMSIRDIKELLKLVKFKIAHGLELDSSICMSFEKNTKHKNYLFSNGIDLIYELFKLESSSNIDVLSKSIKLMNKNYNFNNFFTKFADKGFII